MIEKVLNVGQNLIDGRHFASSQIKEKSDELANAWDNLLDHSTMRKDRLDLSLQTQQVTLSLTNFSSFVLFRCLIYFLQAIESVELA